MNNESTQNQIFISYSRRDEAALQRIVRFLRKQGIKVWVDNERLIPGTPIWEEEIEKAVRGAVAIVVLLSPDSKNSEWVRREITLAEQHEKRIFPVLVRGDEDTSISIRLITNQYVDLRHNERTGLNKLSAALMLYLDELRAQTDAGPVSVIRENPESNLEPVRERTEENETGFEKPEVQTRLKNPEWLKKSPFLWTGGVIGIAVMLSLSLWLGKGTSKNKDAPAEPTPTESIVSVNETIIDTPLPSNSNTRAKGVDISSQGNEINWAQVKNERLDFIFMDAMKGDGSADTSFKNNWTGAKSDGILRGACFHFDPTLDPSEQVAAFLQAFDGKIYDGELPPVVKVDTTDNQSNEEFLSKLRGLVNTIGKKTGRQPIIYSSYDFIDTSLRNQGGDYSDWLINYPLWVTLYPARLPNTESDQPVLPEGWSGTWLFWSYSNIGTVNGIGARVNEIVFKGSLSDLQNSQQLLKKVENRAWGIDVSFFNGDIDWNLVKNTGIDFVFVRASERTNLDPKFKQNWEALKEFGIPRGAYFYFHAEMDPKEQVDFFASQVELLPGDLPPVLDIEKLRNESLSNQDILNSLKIALTELERLTGRQPVIYTGQYFTSVFIDNKTQSYPEWLTTYPLWIAIYPSTTDIESGQPAQLNGWKTGWLFWQYTETGSVEGIPGHVDLNFSSKTPAEFQKYLEAP